MAAEEVVLTAAGSTSAPCTASTSPSWYFPMGTTGGTADLRLGLYNPSATPAVADLSFDTGQPVIEVGPGSSDAPASGGPSSSGAGSTSMPAPVAPLSPSALQGLAVAPGQLVVVDISQQVQLRDLLATSVQVSGGRIVAGEWQSMSGFVPPPAGKGAGGGATSGGGTTSTSTSTTTPAGSKTTSTASKAKASKTRTSRSSTTTTSTTTTSTTISTTTSTTTPAASPAGSGSPDVISKDVADGVLIQGAGRTFGQWWLPDALSPTGGAEGLWLDDPTSVSARVTITVSGAGGSAVTEVELPGGGVTTVVPQMPAVPPSKGGSSGAPSKSPAAPPAADGVEVASSGAVGIVVGRGSASTVSVTTKTGSKTTVKVQTVVSPEGSLGLATASRSFMLPATGWIPEEGDVVVVDDVGTRPADVTIEALLGTAVPLSTFTLQPGSSQVFVLSGIATVALGAVPGTPLAIFSSQPVVAEQDFSRGSSGEMLLGIPAG